MGAALENEMRVPGVERARADHLLSVRPAPPAHAVARSNEQDRLTKEVVWQK